MRIERVQIQKKEIKPGIIVFEMSGSIHMGTECERIDREIEEHLQKKENRLIFDLAGVTHIDSAVVGLIVRNHSRLTRSGGALRLAGAKGMVEGVLKLTQVNKVIPLYATALEASEGFPPQKTES